MTAKRIHLIQGTAAHRMWKGLELQNSQWTLYPINWKQGSTRRCVNPPSLWGRRERQATANKFVRGNMWTQVEAGPVTHPQQHHRGDVPSPPALAQANMGPQPPFRADVQPRAAQEQEGELPENPEPEEPLRTEGPLQEGLMPEEKEEKTQLPQPQISTPGCPTGLVFTHKINSTIPVSTRPCHNERRPSPFQEGNSTPHSAQESG
ncbi:MAG: hypothetical protein GY696_12540 [Gammaproteobacteria bacterium]|nr:hypothetical protein [Gammaproteobacteria bacterium]